MDLSLSNYSVVFNFFLQPWDISINGPQEPLLGQILQKKYRVSELDIFSCMHTQTTVVRPNEKQYLKAVESWRQGHGRIAEHLHLNFERIK